jgi:hypothetical protein
MEQASTEASAKRDAGLCLPPGLGEAGLSWVPDTSRSWCGLVLPVLSALTRFSCAPEKGTVGYHALRCTKRGARQLRAGFAGWFVDRLSEVVDVVAWRLACGWRKRVAAWYTSPSLRVAWPAVELFGDGRESKRRRYHTMLPPFLNSPPVFVAGGSLSFFLSVAKVKCLIRTR